ERKRRWYVRRPPRSRPTRPVRPAGRGRSGTAGRRISPLLLHLDRRIYRTHRADEQTGPAMGHPGARNCGPRHREQLLAAGPARARLRVVRLSRGLRTERGAARVVEGLGPARRLDEAAVPAMSIPRGQGVKPAKVTIS